MELRVLNYFLAIAREGGLTKASETLHVTQPTMSRQIHELEEELGQKLFVRTTRSMTLTPEGMILRKRAEEILEMAERTKAEFASMGNVVAGDIFIGSGESYTLRPITDLLAELRKDYPEVHFHIYSGNAEDVTERLAKGLLDFGVLIEPVDVSGYSSLRLPGRDRWGLIMRKDHPLSQKTRIRKEDLEGIPLITSNQDMFTLKKQNDYLEWFGDTYTSLNVVASYSLLYNGALIVKSGIGSAIGIDKIVDTSDFSDLCFRPFEPLLETGVVIIWKKYQVFSRPAELLLEKITQAFEK